MRNDTAKTKSLALIGFTAFGQVAQAAIPSGCGQTIGSGTIGAVYDPTTETVTITAVIPNTSYAGWGWGGSMADTEMVIFETSTDLGVSYYDGTGYFTPTANPSFAPCYTTTSSVDETTQVATLTATRPLECAGIADSYVIQLDTNLAIITAWDDSSSTLTYHDTNKFSFTQYLGSDGTCSADPPGPEPTPPTAEATCQ